MPSGVPEIIDAAGQAIGPQIGPLNINESLRLTCRVRQGVPAPTIRWDYGGHMSTERRESREVIPGRNGWIKSTAVLRFLKREDLNRRVTCVVQQVPVESMVYRVSVIIAMNRKRNHPFFCRSILVDEVTEIRLLTFFPPELQFRQSISS